MERPPPTRTLTISTHFTTSQIVRLTLVVVAVLLGIYFLQQLIPVAFLLLISVMLATAIEPLVNRLRRGIFNRTAGILVVYTGLFLLLAALAWLTIPVIVAQVSEVARQMPQISRDIHTMAQQSDNSFVKSQLNLIGNAIDQVFVAPPPPSTNPDETAQQVQQTTTTVLSVAEGVFSILAMFVIAF
jgi:predicted PurR-regulated permease PerM